MSARVCATSVRRAPPRLSCLSTQTRADVVSAQYFVGEVLQKEKETSEYVQQLKVAEDRRDATFKAVFEKKLNQEQARRHRAANVCSRTGGVLITAQIQ